MTQISQILKVVILFMYTPFFYPFKSVISASSVFLLLNSTPNIRLGRSEVCTLLVVKKIEHPSLYAPVRRNGSRIFIDIAQSKIEPDVYPNT